MGVDGCRSGWLAVRQEQGGRVSSDVFSTAAELFSSNPKALIAIDIPIGLPRAGRRACDDLARRELGARKSSVFPTPVRGCLGAKSYEEACQISLQYAGKSLSQQSFALLPKIAQVDLCVRLEHLQARRTWEVHPELSFRFWAGQPAAFSKASGFGFAERLALVEDLFPGQAKAVRDRFSASTVADDDILDAFAALWSLQRVAAGRSVSFGDQAEVDEHGLPMIISA
jgi:predicted RNase H-like nuclease